MKRLKSMSVETILKSYAFPHKFYVRYALDCALTVKHLMTDDRSLKALEVTELWLQGKATDEEVKVAANNAAASAATSAAFASTFASTFAYASAAATSYAASAAAYAAAYATSAASYAASYATYVADATLKDMLLKQIETLSEFQRLMLGIEL